MNMPSVRVAGAQSNRFPPSCRSPLKPAGKRDSAGVWLVLALIFTLVGTASAQNTAIAYQGRLKLGGGTPDSDSFFDIRFRLFSAATGGSQLGEVVVPSVGTDSNGWFTAMVDFGAAAFPANATQFIELGARRAGSPDIYTPLLPRQQVVPVPTALRAQQADLAGRYTGTVNVAQLPASVARLDVPQIFTAPPSFMPPSGVPFTVGLTNTVQNLSADLLDGLNSTAFWRRETNGGVSQLAEPARLPFDLRVQNRPVFRLQEGYSNLGWSLVADPSINTSREGVPGSTAFGRGILIESNADYSFAAGDGNRILAGARNSTVGGGARQSIGANSAYSGIFAGYGGVVSSNSRFAGVLLGNYGTVRGQVVCRRYFGRRKQRRSGRRLLRDPRREGQPGRVRRYLQYTGGACQHCWHECLLLGSAWGAI